MEIRDGSLHTGGWGNPFLAGGQRGFPGSSVTSFPTLPDGIRGAQIAPSFLRTMGPEHATWAPDSALSGIPHLVAAFPRSRLPTEKEQRLSICGNHPGSLTISIA